METKNLPIFKGSITVYSAPLMDSELAKLTEQQREYYKNAGNVSIMVNMRDGVEVNVPGIANAMAAMLTAFIRGIPFQGDAVEQLHAVRAVVDQVLVRTALAFDHGKLVSEGREQ